MSDELKDLAALWTTETARGVDLERIGRRDARRVRLAVIVEWLASASVVGFWAVQVSMRPHPITWTLGLGSCAFVVAWLVVMHRTMRVPEIATSTREYLRQQIARAQREARWFGFVRSSSVAFALFAAPVGVWKLAVDRAMYEAEPWRAVVGLGGGAVMLAGLLLLARSRRLEAEELARTLAKLESSFREEE